MVLKKIELGQKAIHSETIQSKSFRHGVKRRALWKERCTEIHSGNNDDKEIEGCVYAVANLEPACGDESKL